MNHFYINPLEANLGGGVRLAIVLLLIIVMTLFLANSLLNQTYAFKIVTVGDLDCSQRSSQTMNSIIS